jgi:hypothetical protein
MPFGLRQTALILSWNPGSADASRGGLQVEWNRPLSSQKLVRVFGTEMHLLKFDRIEESLLLIPLGPARPGTAQNQQPLATSKAWALISIESDSELDATVREFKHWRAGLGPQALAKREIAFPANYSLAK